MKNWPDNYLTMQQGSAEWLQERTGKVTASRVKDVLAVTRSGEGAARGKYKMELLTELITGNAAEHYVSPAMDFGTEYEPVALAAYEMAKEVSVERIGYVRHPSILRCGASPDGLVGDDGLVEIKVPNTSTHLGYYLAEVVPSDYKPQMLFQMACTGRKWCDFVSYDPRLPEDFGLFIVRFHRDELAIAKMEAAVTEFIAELEAMADKLLKGRPIERREPGPMAPVPAVVPEMRNV